MRIVSFDYLIRRRQSNLCRFSNFGTNHLPFVCIVLLDGSQESGTLSQCQQIIFFFYHCHASFLLEAIATTGKPTSSSANSA